jgi:putative ABC transport system permease protein
MTTSLIPVQNLFFAFAPVSFVLWIFYFWKLDLKRLVLACVRMLSQLILIGYLLKIIFKFESAYFTFPIVFFMMSVSAWIALQSISNERKHFYKKAWIAMLLGALPNLFFTCYFLIPSQSWYSPQFLIPLAGMVFAQSMNTIGICSERFESERKINSIIQARNSSFQASLIPHINNFLAVGLVSLPGMMTGQILAGVSPLIAVRYQILIMTLVMSAGATSSFIYLTLRTRALLD